MKNDVKAYALKFLHPKKNILPRMSLRKFYFFIYTLFEWLVAVFFTLVALLIMPILFAYNLAKGKKTLLRKKMLGRSGKIFTVGYFNCNSIFFKNLPLFWWVVFGKMRIIGVSLKEAKSTNRYSGDEYLYNEKPGIYSLWFIRSASRTAFADTSVTDFEYYWKHNPLKDTMLFLRSIPALIYYSEKFCEEETIELLNVGFANFFQVEAIARLAQILESRQKTAMFYVNPNSFNLMAKDREFFEIIRKNNLNLPDGIGLVLASKIIGKPLKENLNGTDFFLAFCNLCQIHALRVFFLGSEKNVAAKAASKIKALFPDLRLSLIHI